MERNGRMTLVREKELYGSRTVRRTRMVSKTSVAASGQRMSASDSKTSTPYTKRWFSQSRNVRVVGARKTKRMSYQSAPTVRQAGVNKLNLVWITGHTAPGESAVREQISFGNGGPGRLAPNTKQLIEEKTRGHGQWSF